MKLLSFPVLIFTITGLLIGIVLIAFVNFDFLPIWNKLPPVVDKPINITNVELGNKIIKTSNNKSYRCDTGSDQCWTENLELTVPSWWDNRGWEYYFRSYESCDYSKPYFLTWRFSTNKIIDCRYEKEGFVDWGVSTVVLIDQRGDVWQHTYSSSAIASNTAILIFPILCTIGELISGVFFMTSKTILQKMKLRKAEASISINRSYAATMVLCQLVKTLT